MTCIVGLVEGNAVYMGGDSAGVAGYDLCVRDDRKVFRNGPMVFGFTTSFRMGQLLQHALTIPDHDPRVPLEKFMVTTFMAAVRKCLKNNGWAEKKNEQERGGVFLVGYKGRLFRVEGDYQIGLPVDGFDACGCGEAFAIGVLCATPSMAPRERVRLALDTAERRSAGVRAPFHIEVLGGE